jgi:hypothetical protein
MKAFFKEFNFINNSILLSFFGLRVKENQLFKGKKGVLPAG